MVWRLGQRLMQTAALRAGQEVWPLPQMQKLGKTPLLETLTRHVRCATHPVRLKPRIQHLLLSRLDNPISRLGYPMSRLGYPIQSKLQRLLLSKLTWLDCTKQPVQLMPTKLHVLKPLSQAMLAWLD